ncbi:short-chain dehydrogenase [Bacillus sp. V3-13]|uniref:SDR family NAD(P)-dependent oxidoreductase n=1 Tax=Bacillus sp. V3-13 TaxID=2053728 RepID=UPI000C7747FB|nr:SDR family oxidoreductase [Bacillus sp. V3-13]PLR78611.1 short-chain dehydrogenase [Bacillus sp. V3-13]
MGERLKGKIALVTGSARGLGAMECKAFAEEGASLIIMADVLKNELEETVKLVEKAGSARIIPIELDVSKEEDWINAVDLIDKEIGKLDILVNNAGVTKRVKFVDCTLEEWNWVISINQTGTFLGMKYCAELLKRSGSGSIINKSSIAGMTGYFAAPYTASKWAVRGMTKAAAMEFAEMGIRVNSVNPGFIWSPLTEPAKDMVEKFYDVTAMQRAGQPEDIANAVLYLASDESSFVTGSELVVDGGLTAGGEIRSVAKSLGIY